MLNLVSSTFPVKHILYKWFPAEHTKATCELCEKEDETIAHFALSYSKSKDATTAAHDKVRRRLSKALEKALANSSDRWALQWEKQAGLAFPGLIGT